MKDNLAKRGIFTLGWSRLISVPVVISFMHLRSYKIQDEKHLACYSNVSLQGLVRSIDLIVAAKSLRTHTVQNNDHISSPPSSQY